jgi:tetratricopeptide (TPR) repeat protein
LQGDLDGAAACYEQALRHNSYSIPAMLGVANILKQRDQFAQAIDYLNAITKIEDNHGEVWALLGKCLACTICATLTSRITFISFQFCHILEFSY